MTQTQSIRLTLALPGDVLFLRVFGQVVVVLCSLSAVKDLLEKRGNAYADRPTLPIVEMYAPTAIITPHLSAILTTCCI
jgi:hypothetical protein